MKTSKMLNRRRFLQATAASAATLTAPITWSANSANSDRRFLFVIGANGGASIVDSFLPILDTDSNTKLNAFTADQIQEVPGSNFRCTRPFENLIQGAIPLGDGYDMGEFLKKHTNDMAVVTQQVSSVNHQIASRRSVDGNGINSGRTLQEAVATRYGQGLLLPNANMAADDYGGAGYDSSISPFARAQTISDPRSMAFATHGFKGINNLPAQNLIAQARNVRQQLSQTSDHKKAFNARSTVSNYLHNRDTVMQQLEYAEVINQLLLLPKAPNGQPLSDFGLEQSSEAQELFSQFPNLVNDPLEAQTALAFLLVKTGLSCAVTLEPSETPFLDASTGRAITSPLAYDWSHINHRGTQNAMWGRIMNMTDKLISLLKATEFQNGESFWDRSLVYIATDFGREKVSMGGSGHHLNNGNVLISPYLNGNRVYGGVDANTALTYGFDPASGTADPSTTMNEGDIYSAICHAMDIDFEGRRDMPALVKAS